MTLVLGTEIGHRAGIVHQDVDPTETGDDVVDESGTFVGNTDVGLHRDRTGKLRSTRVEAIQSSGRHHHLRAGGVKDAGESDADARRGPRDQHYPTIKPKAGEGWC